jgi:hypothetical protein
MRPAGKKISPFSLLILAWMILWVTTVPLFHTHLPDTSDASSSREGGLAHTVFSPDLPGEYSRSYDVTHQAHFFHLSNHVPNSPELGFVLLDENLKHRKLGQPSVLVLLFCPPPIPFHAFSTIESTVIPPNFLLSDTPRGPRPPPSIVSV